MKKRLDLILVEREFFETREKAKREIMAGNVIVNEQVITKAGTMFKDNDELSIRVKDKLRYVSRGGLKLEKAIKTWDLDFSEKLVLDIGASTGGFTDCARNFLKYGITFVKEIKETSITIKSTFLFSISSSFKSFMCISSSETTFSSFLNFQSS